MQVVSAVGAIHVPCRGRLVKGRGDVLEVPELDDREAPATEHRNVAAGHSSKLTTSRPTRDRNFKVNGNFDRLPLSPCNMAKVYESDPLRFVSRANRYRKQRRPSLRTMPPH